MGIFSSKKDREPASAKPAAPAFDDFDKEVTKLKRDLRRLDKKAQAEEDKANKLHEAAKQLMAEKKKDQAKLRLAAEKAARQTAERNFNMHTQLQQTLSQLQATRDQVKFKEALELGTSALEAEMARVPKGEVERLLDAHAEMHDELNDICDAFGLDTGAEAEVDDELAKMQAELAGEAALGLDAVPDHPVEAPAVAEPAAPAPAQAEDDFEKRLEAALA